MTIRRKIAWRPGEGKGHEATEKTLPLIAPLASGPIPLARTTAIAAEAFINNPG